MHYTVSDVVREAHITMLKRKSCRKQICGKIWSRLWSRNTTFNLIVVLSVLPFNMDEEHSKQAVTLLQLLYETISLGCSLNMHITFMNNDIPIMPLIGKKIGAKVLCIIHGAYYSKHHYYYSS